MQTLPSSSQIHRKGISGTTASTAQVKHLPWWKKLENGIKDFVLAAPKFFERIKTTIETDTAHMADAIKSQRLVAIFTAMKKSVVDFSLIIAQAAEHGSEKAQQILFAHRKEIKEALTMILKAMKMVDGFVGAQFPGAQTATIVINGLIEKTQSMIDSGELAKDTFTILNTIQAQASKMEDLLADNEYTQNFKVLNTQ